MSKVLHSGDDIDWLYVSWKGEGSELGSIEDFIDETIPRTREIH